jgi:poly(3-hydroxybutyrate) depolymerase
VGGSSTIVDSSASGGKSTVGGSSATVDSSASGGKGGTGGSTVVGGSSVSGGSATGGTSRAGGTTGAGGAGGTAGLTAKTGGTSALGGSASGGTAAGGTGASGGAKPSDGCGKDPPTLKSAIVGQATPVNTISGSRQFLVRWPTNYDNKKAYPLHIGLHGHGGDLSENGKDNFGLWSLSKNTVIFVTLAAVSGNWDGPTDLAYADAVLKQVESELCIDTSRVMMEGFSQGGAMAWYITGSRPGVYRAVVGHSGGGVSGIPTLSPVAYLGTLGTSDVSGNSQATQTDQFAKVDGCTIETLPTATTGKHVCTPYKGCKDGFPVTWCSYDGGHGFQDTDSGSSSTWVPQAVWDFLSKLL